MSPGPESRAPQGRGRGARQNSGGVPAGQWSKRRQCTAGPILLAVLSLLAAAVGPTPVWGQETAADGPAGDPASDDPVVRGAYIFAAAGCGGCHTDVKTEGPLAAGGRALETPFGVFYSPNITPDPETGIGDWSEADFHDALRKGIAPDGSPYFPVFPYTSFTMMGNTDIADLWAYVQTLPPVERANREHDADFPFGWRALLPIWRWLNFEERPIGEHIVMANAETARGAYLVNALGHCGECHTPRDLLGALDRDRHLSGTPDGPEGGKIPNITPDETTGIGSWSDAEILRVLETGMLPDFDVVGGGMGEVVRNSTSLLTDEDRRAIVAYLRTLTPIENDEARATQPEY